MEEPHGVRAITLEELLQQRASEKKTATKLHRRIAAEMLTVIPDDYEQENYQ